MKLIPAQNPPNPWEPHHVEYFGEAPPIDLVVYEDHAKGILAENDSPDVGFRWSLNPYRGCMHACAYCMSGDTPILMADGRTRPLADLRPGDAIYGTTTRGNYRRYKRTHVLDHWSVVKPAHRILLSDGTELVASADHRFLTTRGWKYVTGAEHGRDRRPHLTLNDRLLGVGGFASTAEESECYRRGYLCGVIRGDGSIGTYAYTRCGRLATQHRFRLALSDFEPLARASHYLERLHVSTYEIPFANTGGRRPMRAIVTQAKQNVDRIRDIIAFPFNPSQQWREGFLAGIFDAEGSCSGALRISNSDPVILELTMQSFRALGFDAILEPPESNGVANARLRGGVREQLRFFHTTDPTIVRKRSIDGLAVKHKTPLRVVAIEPLGRRLRLFDITTGTGDFVANGVISHNCYARPSHEYLGFGAGTDFDRRIVVKPKAAELLREAFDKKSWVGELVMFSGNTDCYQPLEASYRLTRGCLEVCAEYGNPAYVITKAALIERDIDVLQSLQKSGRVGVTISIPFWNVEHARAIEPYVPTPRRRMQAVRKLSAAGIDVNVNVAPVIPGLNDRDIPSILEAAAEAGAKTAAMVMLRLPGPVRQVFEERLRAALPLSVEKVLARTRETRGGRLNDPRFGSRMTGEGVYADAIKKLFETTAERLGLRPGDWGDDDEPTTFRRPLAKRAQLALFK